jgi:hypothetical protein
MTDLPGSLLDRVFPLQEEVLRRNTAEFKDRYDFISACIDLGGKLSIPDQSWETLPISQRVIFNYFDGDASSTLINAIRLGFQGCETDSYALMRVVLENLTVLQYIIKFTLYDEAYSEVVNKVRLGKRFSQKYSYKTAVKKLGIKDRRDRVKGSFSNFGSHPSPSRLAMSRFKIGDNDFPKVGVAINNPRTKMAIGELAALALFFVEITDDFLMACLAENAGAFHQRRVELESLYKSLKDNQAPKTSS